MSWESFSKVPLSWFYSMHVHASLIPEGRHSCTYRVIQHRGGNRVCPYLFFSVCRLYIHSKWAVWPIYVVSDSFTNVSCQYIMYQPCRIKIPCMLRHGVTFAYFEVLMHCCSIQLAVCLWLKYFTLMISNRWCLAGKTEHAVLGQLSSVLFLCWASYAGYQP